MDLLSFFRIQRSERSVLAWSLALGVIIGALLCYISSVPLAMFLETYSSENLPLIYILGALVVLGFGLLIHQIQQTFSFKILTQALVLFICFSATLFWLIAIIGKSKILIFILVVWAIMAFAILEMTYWMLINQIYTIQQGKRLYGIIGGVQSLGGVTAGFLSPWVISKIGVNNVILLIAALAFLAWNILVLLQKRFMQKENRIHDKEEAASAGKMTFSEVLKNSYVFKIIVIMALCAIGHYLIDLLFNTLAERRYPSEAALAGFLGTIFATVDLFDFFCSTFLVAWILTRFGLMTTLMIQPFVLALVGLLLSFLNLIPTWMALIFWCTVLLKVSEETLRVALFNRGFLLLYQPMIPKLRAWLQSKMDMFIWPAASSIMGVILFLVSHYIGVKVGYFAVTVIVVFSLMGAILLTLKKDYLKALANALSTHGLLEPVFEKLDKDSLPLFKKYLKNAPPEQLIYILSLLENIDEAEFIHELAQAFASNNEMLREYALEKMLKYRAYQYVDKARVLATQDPSTLVRARALTVLLDYGDEALQNKALDILKKMQESEDPQKQMACVKIIANSQNKLAEHLLPLLIDSPNPAVKIAALKAAIQRHLSPFYSFFMENLSEENIENGILENLPQLDDKFLSLIISYFPRYDIYVQKKLIEWIGEMQTQASFEFLEKLIHSELPSIRNEALRSILEYKKNPSLPAVSEQITKEIKELDRLSYNLSRVPTEEITFLLRKSLQRRMHFLAQGILLKLNFFYPRDLIAKVQAALETYETVEVSYAIELLDSILEAKHKRDIVRLMLLTFSPDTAQPSVQPSYEILREYLHEREDPLDQLICAACLFIIGKLSLPDFAAEKARFANSSNALIRETALEARSSP